MSEHCAWRGPGVLNDLFGIEAPPSERREPRAAPAGGGPPLLKIGPAEAAIVRRVGKGWVVYLNRLLDGYAEERKKGYGGAADRALLGRLLEHLGVAAPVRISTPAGSP